MAYAAFRIFPFVNGFPHYELDRFEEEFYREWLAGHGMSDDRLLFHYTDVNGLKGILNDRGIRMSHSSAMNDPSELEYGKLLVVQEIEKLLSHVREKAVEDFLQRLITIVRIIGEQMHGVFVTCFCEDGDLLSQWRGYSQRGSGYNLGFRFSANTHFASVSPALAKADKPALRKVIYDRSIQERWVSQYLTGVLSAAENVAIRVAGIDLAGQLSSMLFTVQGTLIDLVLSFKNPAFKEENEWRLFRLVQDHHEPKNIGFTFTESSIRPYRCIWLFDVVDNVISNFPVFRITAGPAHDPAQVKHGVRLFLHSMAAIDDAEVPLNPRIEIVNSSFRFRS